MRAKYTGNKADRIMHVVKNGEATLTIPRGSPLVLKYTGTADPDNDGLAVVLPNTAGSASSFSVKYGVATQTMAPGEFGETILAGIAPYALVQKMTRSATTASWSGAISYGSGVPMGIDTVNNLFAPGTGTDTLAGSVLNGGFQAVLLDQVAAIPASASNTSDARTVIYGGARAFIRML